MAHEPGHDVLVHAGLGPARAAGVPPAVELERRDLGPFHRARLGVLDGYDVTAFALSGKHVLASNFRTAALLEYGLASRCQRNGAARRRGLAAWVVNVAVWGSFSGF